MLNIKWNITQKLDPTLKPSNYEQLRKIRMFSAQKFKCPRRFQEIDPEVMHTCLMCPCQSFYDCVFFFAGNVGSVKTEISKKIRKQKYLAEKKTIAKKRKKHSQKTRQGHIKHVRKISGSISQKRRGHWTLKEFGVLCFNQPVSLASRNMGITTNRRFHELEH